MLGIETLLIPVFLMMGLAFVYSVILRNVTHHLFCQVAFGVTFGFGTVLAMTAPIHFGDGLIFDLRGLLVGLAVVFAGWVAGILTACFAIVYRLYLGGAGVAAGCVGILLAIALGALWRWLSPQIRMPAMLKDACFGMVSSFTLLALFLLPIELAVNLSVQVGPSILLANLIGAVTLGFVLRREIEQLRSAEELRMIAEVDPLTNLLNRRGALRARSRIGDEVGKGQALLYFDVDHFKSINDLHGHIAGDAALAAVAARIKNVVRKHVIFSRHGGDEFIIFMSDVTEANALVVANRLRQVVNDTPVSFGDRDIRVSISVGGYWTDEAEPYDQMLLKADTALMQAKAMGRNRVHVASLPVAAQVSVPSWQNPSRALH